MTDFVAAPEGESVGEIVEETIQEIDATVTEAIGEAVEAQQEAEANAEAILEGAMESARMQRVENLEREVSECRITLEALPGMMAEQVSMMLDSRLAEFRAELPSAGAGVPPEVVIVPAPEAPIAASESTPEALEAEAIAEAPIAAEAVPLESVVESPRARRHRFL